MPQNEMKRLQKISMGIFRKVLDDRYGFTIPGFGTFSTTLREKRKSFNPVKLIFVILPVKRIISFHPGLILRTLIKNKGLDDDR